MFPHQSPHTDPALVPTTPRAYHLPATGPVSAWTVSAPYNVYPSSHQPDKSQSPLPKTQSTTIVLSVWECSPSQQLLLSLWERVGKVSPENRQTSNLHVNEVRFQYWWHGSFNVVQFDLRSIQSDLDQPVGKEIGKTNIQLMACSRQNGQDTNKKVPRTAFSSYKKESRSDLNFILKIIWDVYEDWQTRTLTLSTTYRNFQKNINIQRMQINVHNKMMLEYLMTNIKVFETWKRCNKIYTEHILTFFF